MRRNLILAILALITCNASASIEVTACGQVLDVPGETYTLEHDIQAIGNCLTITASNVTFDGNGYWISGDGSGTGIRVASAADITVRNVKVKRFSTAIRLNYANGTIVEGASVSSSFNGIYLLPAHNGTIRDNEIIGTHFGLRVRASTGNQITGNHLTGNSYSFPLWYSSNNVIERNVIENSGSYGMNIGDSFDNLIYNNIFANYRNTWLAPWSVSSNTWSVPPEERENIIGGPYVGGNYWSDPSGNGISDNCLDHDGNGFCDQLASIGPGNIDFSPLTKYVPDRDSDEDGVLDKVDNCPQVPNTDQLNFDGDDWGDACDSDDDNDGVSDYLDACPFEYAWGNDGNLDGCIDRIEDLPQIAANYDAPGKSLVAKAEGIASAYERGNKKAAFNLSRALIHELQAQRWKTLTWEEVEELMRFLGNISSKLKS
jgi:parallel beta-helix repeat protein